MSLIILLVVAYFTIWITEIYYDFFPSFVKAVVENQMSVLALWLSLNFLDWDSTRRFIQKKGIKREGNPLGRMIFRYGGMRGLTWFKLGFCSLLFVYFVVAGSYSPASAFALTVLFTLIVLNNYVGN